jgi:hypothetical protein
VSDWWETNGAGSLGTSTNNVVPDHGTSARVLNRPDAPIGVNVGGGPGAVRMYRGMAMGASPLPQGPNAVASGAAQYFAASQRTVEFVEKVMDIGPSNRLSKAFWGFPARQLCVREMRDKTKNELDDLAAQLAKSGKQETWADQMEASAGWAKLYGCGNCGEYSSLAFVHLRDVEKVRPLDWMEYNNLTHAFVIIGRKSGTLPAKELDYVDAAAIKDWGDAAVLCDAYYSDTVAMPKLITRFEGKKLHLLHRVE